MVPSSRGSPWCRLLVGHSCSSREGHHVQNALARTRRAQGRLMYPHCSSGVQRHWKPESPAGWKGGPGSSPSSESPEGTGVRVLPLHQPNRLLAFWPPRLAQTLPRRSRPRPVPLNSFSLRAKFSSVKITQVFVYTRTHTQICIHTHTLYVYIYTFCRSLQQPR